MNSCTPELLAALAASDATSPYERLGVSHSSSPQERKAAHRTLSRILHPDIIRDEQLRPRCNDALARINDAFDILSDPIRELAWRVRNGFTIPSERPTSPRTTSHAASPPPAKNPEISELVSRITSVSREPSEEQLINLTEQLVNRLLYAHDCRQFILDPTLRAAISSLITCTLAGPISPGTLSPLAALIRLFVFERHDPPYQEMVQNLISMIKEKFTSPPFFEVDQLFAIARSLDAELVIHHPDIKKHFATRLRQALFHFPTDRELEIVRLTLIKIQETYCCLSELEFLEIQRESYLHHLSQIPDPITAADIRRRLHMGADDAVSAIGTLLDETLNRIDSPKNLFLLPCLAVHLLRYDLSRTGAITDRARMIQRALLRYFADPVHQRNRRSPISALLFFNALPDEVQRLISTPTLRRAALASYRRCREKSEIPENLNPENLMNISTLDRLISFFN
jgi:hypothetical protein